MSNMPELLKELESMLSLEIEAYEQLLQLQQSEKRLVVSQALDPLLASLQEKAHRTHKIAALEGKRQQVTAQLAPLVDLPVSAMTLQQLSSRVAEPHATTLQQQRTRLRTLAEDLQRLNSEHAVLLRDSLAFVESALAFFARLVPSGSTYQQTGGFCTPRQGRVLCGRV